MAASSAQKIPAVGWTGWLKIVHSALLAVLVLYFTMVGANSLAFGYNFWTEPAPSDGADAFAVASLWALLFGAALVGAITYTWLCACELNPEAAMRTALQAAIRTTLHRAPIATLGFLGTTLACFLVVPGPVTVALLGGLAARRLRERGWPANVPPAPSCGPFQTGVIVTALTAGPFFLALLGGFAIADEWDGVAEGLAAVLAYAAAVTAGLAAAWAAQQFTRRMMSDTSLER